MCEKCAELDKQHERYTRLRNAVLDEKFVEAMDRLIEDLIAQKLALHPEQPTQE